MDQIVEVIKNNNQPFLIERGDIIRVEGVLVQRNVDTEITSSFNIIEDFTVEEVQDYYYSSSYDDQNQDASQLINPIDLTTPAFENAAAFSATLFTGLPVAAATWVGYAGLPSSYPGVVVDGNSDEGAAGGSAGSTSTALKITIVSCTTTSICDTDGVTSIIIDPQDSYGWDVGDTITIKNQELSLGSNWGQELHLQQ